MTRSGRTQTNCTATQVAKAEKVSTDLIARFDSALDNNRGIAFAANFDEHFMNTEIAEGLASLEIRVRTQIRSASVVGRFRTRSNRLRILGTLSARADTKQ